MTAVIITGASRGLGAALARRYSAPGVTLGLIARNRAGLERVGADCAAKGASVRIIRADVSDRSGIDAAVRELDAAAPTDVLIANAGIERGPAPGATIEDAASLARVLDTNLVGAALTAAAVLPAMQVRGRGQIAFIASVAAYRGLPDSPAYCASKAALRVLAEALRPRVAGDGIAVSVVLPGFFHSAMSEQWQGRRTSIMSAEAMAERIARGLERRQARIVVPRRLGLLMQLLDLLPAPIGDRLILRSRFQIDNSGANAAS
jgi:short-subunit dehydrogenase